MANYCYNYIEITRDSTKESNFNSYEIKTSFESRWVPPIEDFKILEKLGFKIDCIYIEEGNGFAGRYHNGIEEYVEYDFLDSNWRDNIYSEKLLKMMETHYQEFIESGWHDDYTS
jgi:hypothetical protein